MKEICETCGSEFDETEYMQFVKLLVNNDEKNKIEDFTTQKLCVDCFTKNEFPNTNFSVIEKVV
jgi:hypothetical protein